MDFEVPVGRANFCRFLVAASTVVVTASAGAHHSVAYYGDEYIEVRGVLVDVDWINPHVRLTLEADNGGGTWRMEGSSVYPLRGAGVTADLLPVGTRVTAIGTQSTREDFMMLVETIRLENGRELPLWDLVGRVPRELPVVDATAEDRGIFRVWSVPYHNIQLQLEQLGTQPFTESAVASRASWNPLDNFATRCEAEGMPRIMVNPHPFEFIDRGSEITLRTELYDIVRTIHMDRDTPPDDEPWGRLGYSVGTWEGNDLVVTTTRVNWPFFDNVGTRQSENVEITERFTLNEDQTRLDFEVTVVDETTFTEPAVLRGYWLALGESIAVYDCVPVSARQLDYRGAADYSTANEGVSMLVMQSGEIIFEEYANGGGPDTAWVTASGTKSFWGVLLAAMVQDGEARIDELVADTITEWQADPVKREITVSHLLSMTDGLAGQAPGPDPVETYAEAVALPTVNPPGAAFVYRPASFQIFGEWVRRKVAGRYSDAVEYMQARIFDHLGIAPAYWPTEADGLPRMPSSSEWTARNWAVFGEFVRLGGNWNGQQLVDPDALAANFAGTAANAAYGLGWWLARPVPEGVIEQPSRTAFLNSLPADERVPDDTYIAMGGGNQRMYVIPSAELVIVRQQQITRAGPVPSDFSDQAFWQHLLGDR